MELMKYSRVIGLGVLGLSLCLASDISLVEEIVAKVNSDIVTRGELERGRKMLEAEMRRQNVPAARFDQELAENSKNILRDRIDELLLVQKGKELNINVDAEVTKEVARIQSESKIADPEKFQQYVREQLNMPFEDYRSEMKNSMLRNRVIREEVARRVNIKPEEARKYYDEHKAEFMREERVFLREILISTQDKDAAGIAAAEKKAKDLAARAAKGERFPELARDNSDSQSAQNGGDIGPWEKGKLREDFEKAIWDQPRGFVSQPFKVANGFLIFKVDDHQKAGQATYEEVQNEVMDRLFNPRMGPAMREYLTKLRMDSFLEIKEGYIDTGAAPGKNTAWTDPAQLKPETVTKSEVANQIRRKRLLWMVPLPGSNTQKESSSK